MNKSISDITLFFYNYNGIYYYILENDDENEFYSCEKLPKGYHTYEALRSDQTYESLVEYKENFHKWNKQLYDFDKEHNHQVKGYRYLDKKKVGCNGMSVYRRFLNHNKIFDLKYGNKRPKVGVQSMTEFIYNESCFNGGLRYIDPSILNKETECYGYDFPAFYAYLMSKEKLFRIPLNEGTEMTLTELPRNVSVTFGFYRVKITSTNPDARKVFAFNKRHIYVNYCLAFAIKHRALLDFEIELIQDGKPNAYIYKNLDTWSSPQIFEQWYDELIESKKLYPDNVLIKHLLSTLYGTLIAFRKNDDIDEDSTEVSLINDPIKTKYKIVRSDFRYDDDGELVEHNLIVDTEDPYKHPYARMKSFLTSYARCYVGNYIIRHKLLDRVLRVCTDSFMTNSPIDHSHLDYHALPEQKTTGLLTWISSTNNTRSKQKRDDKKQKLKEYYTDL